MLQPGKTVHAVGNHGGHAGAAQHVGAAADVARGAAGVSVKGARGHAGFTVGYGCGDGGELAWGC